MAKIDKLLNKTVRDGEAKKWVVVVGIVVGVLIAGGLFFAVMFSINPILDEYFKDTKEITNLYDFYDLKVGENEASVYFVGSSIIGCSIYPPEINKILDNNSYNVTVYNLIISGDISIERSIEIQKIIDSKPSLVIFGITYRSVTSPIDDSRFGERTKLVYDRLNIRNDSLYLFTDEEIKEYFSQPSILYFKTFLINALFYSGKSSTDPTLDYNYDPYGINNREFQSNQKNPSEIIRQSQDPNDAWRPVVTNESTRYKEALIYNVKTLQNAGIPVIIINMPLHSLFSEKITDESRQNYFDLLNRTGAIWYDMECDYGDDFFYDSHHATFDGSMQFAPRMADLIIEQVENDVIHYT